MKKITVVFFMVFSIIANSYSQECVDEAYRNPILIVAQDFFENGISYYNISLEAKKRFDWNDWANSLSGDSVSAYQNFLVVQNLGNRFGNIFPSINQYDLKNKIGAIPLIRSELNSKLKKEHMESSSAELAQALFDAEKQAKEIVSDIENCQKL